MRQFSALAPGTGRFRNSCYFGNLLLSREQIPPFGGLWNEGCARQYGMAGSLQTACGRPVRRFSGTAENIRTGKPLSGNRPPFIFPERLRQSRPGGVQRPVPHTGPSPDTPASPEFPLLSIGLPEKRSVHIFFSHVPCADSTRRVLQGRRTCSLCGGARFPLYQRPSGFAISGFP